ncbi:MAG: glucose-6-phosphate dehydrogenase [Flavobacteriales bacterium]|nr:glucose-6-phosphate dehydrogenase [Flavobacteriales bacterium]
MSFKSFSLVIFGGDGDLALRKIFPAIYYRIKDKQISAGNQVLAVSRTEMDTDTFMALVVSHLQKHIENLDAEALEIFTSMISFISADLTKAEDYVPIKKALEEAALSQTLFYYSTPSSLFGTISRLLHANSILNDSSKVILEKPLGLDLNSFEEINTELSRYFAEPQMYRIDHYLGKETVQNLMVLRFANHLFELAWNAQNIDNVQITVAESIGVEKRKEFYDACGALKDMVQNHLLQLLCLVAMEPPATLTADNVRDEKLKVLKSLRTYNPGNVRKWTVKGQYARGEVADQQVNSYQEDIGSYDSSTETFVALRTYIDNWRWAGVPFYLRTGKRLEKRYSEIVINFKRVPHNVFPAGPKIDRNKLIIRLQPEEHIELVQMAKTPGPGGYRYEPVSLKLDFIDSFDRRFPEAYERLLMDVVRGNQTLFMRADEVRASWKWIHSITDSWNKTSQEVVLYKSGSKGPGDKVMEPGDEWYESKNGHDAKKVSKFFGT